MFLVYLDIPTIKLLRTCNISLIFFGPVNILMYVLGLRLLLVYASAFYIGLSICIYYPYLYAIPKAFNR